MKFAERHPDKGCRHGRLASRDAEHLAIARREPVRGLRPQGLWRPAVLQKLAPVVEVPGG